MIVNLTQHPATPEQRAAGVVDLAGVELNSLKKALTFETLPTEQEILDRAEYIAALAEMNGLGDDNGEDPIPNIAMIGGALWLMTPLAAELRARYITPVFAFSVRETEEQSLPDGSVRKIAVFKHVGFVPAI